MFEDHGKNDDKKFYQNDVLDEVCQSWNFVTE